MERRVVTQEALKVLQIHMSTTLFLFPLIIIPFVLVNEVVEKVLHIHWAQRDQHADSSCTFAKLYRIKFNIDSSLLVITAYFFRMLSCFAQFFVQLAACSLQLAVYPVYESIASVSEVHGAWNLSFFRMCVKAYE